MSIYSGHSHSFDAGIARALGMNAAVIFNHIVYWLRINASKGTEHNIRDGKVWMYESQQEMANFLDYMTLPEIKKAVTKLLESGLLIKANFNKNSFDQTNWYTTADQSIIQKVLTKAPYGAIERSLGSNPQIPTAPSHYIQEEHIHKDKEQQQRAREPAAKVETETAAAFSKTKEEEVPYKTTVFPNESIEYTSPGGIKKTISSSEIYKHFLKKCSNTQILQKAIAKAKAHDKPIGNIFSFIEFLYKSIETESHKPVKSKNFNQVDYNSPDCPIPKSQAPGVGWNLTKKGENK